MKRITTSIASFKNIINAGCLYVDKTSYIYELVKEPFGQFFFARPRRFGKSLTVSTLEAIFNGERELFRGLYIDHTDYEWTWYPVIRIDFARSDSTTKSNLESWLNGELHAIAKQHEIEIAGSSPALQFGDLIKGLYHKYKKGVVILIDEYDRPITNNLEDGKRTKQIRQLMEAFYQMIKGYEEMERFVFLTGITRLSQVSVFSKLNNLRDISRNVKFAGMVGYTKEELWTNFAEYIAAGAKEKQCTEAQLKEKLAYWYDGFRFTFSDVKVYNPVSVGNFFLEEYEFRNYWYATATPAMLINQAKKQRLSVESMNRAVFTEVSYSSFDVNALTGDGANEQLLIQLLFQTGYLTFGEKLNNPMTPTYRLVYPNYEVQISFEMELASIYAGQGVQEINSTVANVQQAAATGDVEGMIARLRALFASIPYHIQMGYEKYYQSLLYLVFKMCGMDVRAEEATNIGRIDAVLQIGEYVYVMECKIDKSAEEALQQVKDKQYCERYQDGNKTIIAIGINFSSDKQVRNISEYRAVVVE